MKALIFLALALVAGFALADPASTSRIQQIEVNGQVITLTLAEGVLTTIEFPDDDEIKTPSFGDELAWTHKHEGNLLVLKPKAPNAGTNLTVFAKKRAYLFRIDVLRSDEFFVPYWVKLSMPPPPPPVLTAGPARPAPPAPMTTQEKSKQAQQLIEREFKTAQYRGRVNFDYWAQGSRLLQPIAAHDNGQHTYLTFSAASPMPTAFVFDSDGMEMTVDSHYEGQTLVIHRVTDRILLRRGNTVTGITNASYLPLTKPSPSGTVSPAVERVIKSSNP